MSKYSDYSLLQLKHIGHRRIDELVKLGIKRKKVYEKLAIKSRWFYTEAHFSKLHTRADISKAVSILDGMILKIKKKKNDVPVFASREMVKKALAELHAKNLL